MTSPRVSIVIPTYNQADYLHACLASVQKQTVVDWEAIVVNNFSDDHTEQVVRSLGDPRIILVNFANHGVIAASRNLGVARARADWIALLDSDDEWLPEKLERCLAVAEPSVDIVAHPVRMHRNGRVVQEHGAREPGCATFRRLLFEANCLTPSASLIRRRALIDIGGISEKPELVTAEDYDMWLRLAWEGAGVCVVPEALTLYRVHDASSSRSAERHLAATLAVIDRHYQALQKEGTALPGDRLRWRRSRGRAIYGAGRTSQKLGDTRQALAHFARAFREYPWQPRLAVALGLFLLGPLGRKVGL